MTLSEIIGGRLNRTQSLERNWIASDSLNFSLDYYADDVRLSDSTGVDSALMVEKRTLGDSVFVLGHDSLGILGTSRYGDSSVSAWSVVYP